MKKYMCIIGLLLFCVIIAIGRDVNISGSKELDTPKDINILISLNNDNGTKQIYERYVDQYNRTNTQTKLVPHYVASDTHAMLKLIYAKEANKEYDVACLGAEQLHTLRNLNLITSINTEIIRDKGFGWLNDQLPVMMADTTRDGNIYSLPLLRNSMVFYYNTGSVDFNKDTITLNEVFDLLESDSKNFQVAAPIHTLFPTVLAHTKPYQHMVEKEAGNYMEVFSDEKVKLAEQLRYAVTKKQIINYTLNNMNGMDSFFSGKTDFLVAGSNYYRQIKDKAPFSMGTAILALDANTTFPLYGVNIYMIKKQTAVDRDTIWMVMQELLDIGAAQGDMGYMDHLPLSNNQIDKVVKEKEVDSNYFKISTYPYTGFSSLTVSQNTKIQLLLDSSVSKLMNEDIKQSTVLKQLQTQINQILQSQ